MYPAGPGQVSLHILAQLYGSVMAQATSFAGRLTNHSTAFIGQLARKTFCIQVRGSVRKSVIVRYVGILIELTMDGAMFKSLFLFSPMVNYPKFINSFYDK